MCTNDTLLDLDKMKTNLFFSDINQIKDQLNQPVDHPAGCFVIHIGALKE